MEKTLLQADLARVWDLLYRKFLIASAQGNFKNGGRKIRLYKSEFKRYGLDGETINGIAEILKEQGVLEIKVAYNEEQWHYAQDPDDSEELRTHEFVLAEDFEARYKSFIDGAVDASEDGAVSFDENTGRILIGDKTVQLPLHAKEYYLAQRMSVAQVGMPVSWDELYQSIEDTEPATPKKDKKAIQDTVNRLNKRLAAVGVKKRLFAWKNKNVVRLA